MAEPEGPAQFNREDNNASGKGDTAIMTPSPAANGRPVLMLVEGSRGMRSASSRNGALPAPALRSPMLLVVGGHGHASTG